MKRFNVSILAVVAVLAIGLSAFTKAESAKRVTIANCYQSVTLACENDGLVLGGACDDVLPFIQAPVKAIGAFASVDCGATQNVFCCAQLEATSRLCITQPSLTFRPYNASSNVTTFAKIHDVFCKP